jgi:hypothetical protein
MGLVSTMPAGNRSVRRFMALIYSLGFLLPAKSALAQIKSSLVEQKPTPESPTLVVDAVKLEGGTELTSDERTSVANSFASSTPLKISGRLPTFRVSPTTRTLIRSCSWRAHSWRPGA